MSRLNMIILAGLLAAVLTAGGCCTHRTDRVSPCCGQVAEVPPDVSPVVPVMPPPARLASGLIFDHRPGLYSADQFAYRSEWPSTLGYYRAPEVIFYREHFRDRQGPGWSFQDHSYRRFDTVRYGQAVR